MRRSCDYLELWKFDCLYDYYGVKTHVVPQIEGSDPSQSVPMEASTRKERFERKKLHPRRYSFCNKPLQTSGDRVNIWSLGNLIACTITMGSKHTSFPRLKNQTSPPSVPMEASTRKERFEKRKLHRRRYSFCNNPPQTSRDLVIIWRSGNYIACTMTMGSKHTSFPKLKSHSPLKVCAWKRQLARSVLREKNSIRGGTRFVIIPFKCPEIG